MALANLSIYYTWKNIKPSYNKNKFQLQLGMMPLIYQMDLILFLQSRLLLICHKKHKTLTENPPVQVYANRIKNKIVFKTKTGLKLELVTPETMKLLGSTQKRC